MVFPLTQSQQEEMAKEYQDQLSGRIGRGSGSYGMYLDSYFDRGQEQPIMMGTLGGGGGEKNPLGTAGRGGDLQRLLRLQGVQLGENPNPFYRAEAGGDSLARQRQIQNRGLQTQGPESLDHQRQMQNRGPQNLQSQLQRMFGGGIFGGQRPTNQGQLGGLRDQMRQQFERTTQGPETTHFVEMDGQEFRLTNPIPVSQRSQQGGYNRGINPGGMYTGGQGGGFGSPFGGSMRGGRQQPQYGGGMGGGYGGGFPGYGGGGFPGYGGGMGGGYGMPSPPNMGYGNRFPGMQFSGPFAQPMMPQNYGMGGGFGGGYPMPQPRYPMPQPRMPYPMMGGGMGGGYGGGYGGGMGGGYGGGFGDMIQMFGGY